MKTVFRVSQAVNAYKNFFWVKKSASPLRVTAAESLCEPQAAIEKPLSGT